MTPDERTFATHVAAGRFQMGVDRGDWWIVRKGWPKSLIAISTPNRGAGPSAFVFRFDLENYPQVAPTSEPWDKDLDQSLASDLWPSGNGRVATVFNPAWMPTPGAHALYHPIDRLALPGHDNWRIQDSASIWDSSRMDIVDYLKVIHELLHSNEYLGTRRAA